MASRGETPTTTLGSILGLAALAISVGFVASLVFDSSHGHTCDHCGFRWSHGSSSRGAEAAHTCLRCGAVQWWQDHEPRLRQLQGDLQ